MIDYKKVASRVIARLKVMYPSFLSQIKDDPEMIMLTVDEWGKGLNGMLMEDIEKGLEGVRSSGSNFPPSMPEFIKLCGGKHKFWWQETQGIKDRAESYGLSIDMFMNRFDWMMRETFKRARLEGENIPLMVLEKKQEQEQLPDGIKALASKLKQEMK